MTQAPHPSAGIRRELISYTIGFILSITLTLGSFWVASHLTSLTAPTIVALALAQLFVQLVFFLHLGREQGEPWNLGMFVFALGIIAILIGGTLWIMNNLAHLHMQTPTETDIYQDGVVAPQNELH